MLRFCSIFNVLLGVVAVLFFFGLGALSIALAGGPSLDVFLEVGRLLGLIGIAGIFYSCSGIALWRSLPLVKRNSVILTGAGLLFSFAYCLVWFVMLNGNFGVAGQMREPGDPFDEEVVMFVFVPMGILLLVTIEFVFLWRTMALSPKGETTNANSPSPDHQP